MTEHQPTEPRSLYEARVPEDAPEVLKPAALVAAGALAALLLALLVFASLRMSPSDSGTPSTITSTVTQTVPVTQAPQIVTETAPPPKPSPAR